MSLRTRPVGLAMSLIAVLSMGAAGFASTAANAATKAQAPHAHASKKSTACKKAPTPKGTIKISDWEFPDTMNTAQSTAAVTAEIANGEYDGIFTYNSKAQLIPDMITVKPSVKNGGISKNGKTITLHLRPNMKWSDGAAITSADFKFGEAVGMDKLSGPYCSGSCDVISRIDTPNALTAVLHLKQTYAPVLAYGMPPVFPHNWAGAWNNDPHAAAQKIYQDTSFNFEGPNYPTNGPYQVTQFVANDRVVLSPMKYYHILTCGPYLQNVIFAFYASKAGLIAAAASGQTDVTGFGGGYTAADLPQLQKSKAYTIHVTPSFSFEHLEFNLDSTYNGNPNPVANANVRDALSLALDKAGMIQSALGVNKKTAQSVEAWTPWVNTPQLVQPFALKSLKGQYDPVTKKYVTPGTPAAIADAKKLLSRTQWKDGFSVDFITTTGNAVRQAQEAVIQANWAKIGVKVNPTYVPASQAFTDWGHNGTLAHGAFQVAMFGFLGEPDPDQLHYNLQTKYCDRTASVHAAINENYSCIHDTLINTDMSKAAHTFNSKARANYYAAVQVEMSKLSYWIPLYFKPTVSTSTPRVKNFSTNPTQLGPTWNMFAWQVAS